MRRKGGRMCSENTLLNFFFALGCSEKKCKYYWCFENGWGWNRGSKIHTNLDFEYKSFQIYTISKNPDWKNSKIRLEKIVSNTILCYFWVTMLKLVLSNFCRGVKGASNFNGMVSKRKTWFLFFSDLHSSKTRYLIFFNCETIPRNSQ